MMTEDYCAILDRALPDCQIRGKGPIHQLTRPALPSEQKNLHRLWNNKRYST